MRFSSYSILSDPLPGGGYILMNSLSGALDLVDNELGAQLAPAIWAEHGEWLDELVPQLSRQTFEDFVERGHLTERSFEEEKAAVVTIAAAMHDALVDKPRFMIVPNLDCNYRCTYCFERPLQNALKSPGADISHLKDNVVMTPARIDSIFTAIGNVQGEARESGGQIVLYGGEPLEARNLAVVEEIVRLGRARGFYFAAITNGHDIQHFLHLLGEGGIEQVQISIDGLKPTHDRRRVFIGHESSFDRIVENIKAILRHTSAQVQIRVHVDPGNIGEFQSLIDFFGECGWLDRRQVVIYANTIYSKTKQGDVAVGIDVGDIARQLSAIARRHQNIYTSAPAVHAATALRPAFESGERFALKGSYCAANSGNYIFAADGCVYACWESVGKACSRLGTYSATGELALEQPAVDKWFKRSVATVPGCQRCPYALVCGGGCAQYAEYNHGEPYRPYCDDFQRTFRNALAEHADIYLSQVSELATAAPAAN